MSPQIKSGILRPFAQWRLSTVPLTILILLFHAIGVPAFQAREASLSAFRAPLMTVFPMPAGMVPPEEDEINSLVATPPAGAPEIRREEGLPVDLVVTPEREAAVMAQARAERHHFHPKEAGAHGSHPAFALDLHYDASGMTIRPHGVDPLLSPAAAWHTRFACTSIAIDAHAFAPPAGDTPVVIERDRVSRFVAEEAREWWVNSAEGPEHGFTIHSSPLTEPGQLAIDLALSGTLTPVQNEGTILFQDDHGQTKFTYRKLIVLDGEGRELASHMTLMDSGSDPHLILHADLTGATFPITVDPVVGVQNEETLASDGGSGDEFGFASDGICDVVAVSSPGKNNDRGKVYIFEEDFGGTAAWNERTGIVLPAGETPADGDRFGESVALFKHGAEGKTYLAVGAPHHDGTGSVFIYERNQGGTNNWGFVQILQDVDLNNGDLFGQSLDGLDNTLAVGAPSHGAGAVFVHEASSCVFTRTQKINSAATVPTNTDEFGFALALGGDHMIIGAPGENSENGAAYLFKRSSPYAFVQRFFSVDSEAGARLGAVVAIAFTGLLFAISMPFDDVGVGPTLVDAGSVLIFAFFAATLTWALLGTIFGNQAGALFGASLVLNFFFDLVIGAPKAQSTVSTLAGAVFVYLFSKLTFNYLAGDTIVPSTFIDPGSDLGTSIVLLGTTLFMLGAAYNLFMGAMFIFTLFATVLTFGQWQQLFWTATFIANNPQITGRLADPDGDGLVNEVEFAMFLIPILFTPLAAFATLRADGNYELIIQQSLVASGVLLVAQYAQILGGLWYDLGTGPLLAAFFVGILHRGIQARQLVLLVSTLAVVTTYIRLSVQ